MKPDLTYADARDLDFVDLIGRTEAVLARYDKPEVEHQGERMERISRTVDEMPSVYRWFLSLRAWCDHWTDLMGNLHGQRDPEYRKYRQRRDHFKDMASAAKQRYEAASRLITIEIGFDPTGMPRERRGP